VSANVSNLLYLLTIVSFILALRFLSSPKTARRGNQIGAFGMALAIVVTLWQKGLVGEGYAWIAAGMVIGGAIGLVGARRVKMTAMPQMVALFNGVGGGAAALVAFGEFHKLAPLSSAHIARDEGIAILLSALIGSVSFAGSLVAFGKLQELVSGRPITYAGQQVVNALVIGGAIVCAVALLFGPERVWLLAVLLGLALCFGVLFVLPIGGADMPVVISLLNAFTGLAASASGFALHSNVLIVSGMLVGASGTLLTLLMAKAMNRSVANVLFGAFGKVVAKTDAGPDMEGKSVRATSAEDVAVMLAYASNVIIVPGYGLAVAQAQHDVRQLADLLEGRGVDVKYAIHPVAGRMPGHMNVLLAEANVPYEQLKEMDEINPEFPRCDVALVIGANDVTNPAARSNPGSPIYGMPILDVDKAKNIVVLKRSMNPGFAGIDNELYYDPKCAMLFGDAKASLGELIAALKAV
jgi:NAD(P) transhydrogenase subunit beta